MTTCLLFLLFRQWRGIEEERTKEKNESQRKCSSQSDSGIPRLADSKTHLLLCCRPPSQGQFPSAPPKHRSPWFENHLYPPTRCCRCSGKNRLHRSYCFCKRWWGGWSTGINFQTKRQKRRFEGLIISAVVKLWWNLTLNPQNPSACCNYAKTLKCKRSTSPFRPPSTITLEVQVRNLRPRCKHGS